MKTKIVEVTNGPANWGKFLIGRFDEAEWGRQSTVDPGRPLLRAIGWNRDNVLILDLQTHEGIVVVPSGCARADLNDAHQVWVCPMFEPFLEWFYAFTRTFPDWFDTLPESLDLPDAPFSMHGYRRQRRSAP